MKKITVISGKGGTGKTTLSANFSALAKNHVIADCDVDAPNMHLLLEPHVEKERNFSGGKIAVRDAEKCTDCGLCYEKCRFNAVNEDFSINPVKCEGCSVCAEVCPVDAIHMEAALTGQLYESQTKYAPMIHARLKAGAENSGKLVSEVRDKAEERAEKEGKDLVIVDGSPGIGCPVIASLNGVDMALIVTEPSKSGLSDLKRVVKMIEHFDLKSKVIINKFDLNEKMADEIEEFCNKHDLEVMARIPFSPVFVDLLREGKILVEEKKDSDIAKTIASLWNEIIDALN